MSPFYYVHSSSFVFSIISNYIKSILSFLTHPGLNICEMFFLRVGIFHSSASLYFKCLEYINACFLSFSDGQFLFLIFYACDFRRIVFPISSLSMHKQSVHTENFILLKPLLVNNNKLSVMNDDKYKASTVLD